MLNIIGEASIAVNVAAIKAGQGKAVLVIDTDRSQRANSWVDIRNRVGREVGRIAEHAVTIDAVCMYGDVQYLARAALSEFDHVIIVAKPRESVELSSAMKVADTVFVPLRQDRQDHRLLERVNDMVRAAKTCNPVLEAFGFVNRASGSTNFIQLLQNSIDSYDCLSSSVVIHENAVIEKSLQMGIGVHELPFDDDKEQACLELMAFSDMLMSMWEELAGTPDPGHVYSHPHVTWDGGEII